MEQNILAELANGQKSVRELRTVVRANTIGLFNTLSNMSKQGSIIRGDVAPDGSYYYSLAS